jgi:hypothetical protein
MNGELSRLAHHIADLENMAEALTSRLSPVLRPLPVAGQTKEPSPDGMSTLGGALRAGGDRLSAVHRQLYNLLGSLAI